MAIIDPEGLFNGDRLAACSDLAQLYWPRFFLAANTCARIELSYKSIVSRVFGNFQKVPESSEIWQVFKEYEFNYLAVLYEVDGIWWCQFSTSEKNLPKYKKLRDERTPAPPLSAMEKHRSGYIEWKKSQSLSNQSFQKVSESFQRRGVGVGVGVGIGKKQNLSARTKVGVDERFSGFRHDFESYFVKKNGVPSPWDAKEAANLSRWLKANPTITQEQWRQLLNNRARSQLAHGEALSRWLGRALTWITGATDAYGKPTNGVNGNGHETRNERIYREALQSMGDDKAEDAGEPQERSLA